MEISKKIGEEKAMTKGKNVYKQGEIFEKDGQSFMVDSNGQTHRLAKTNTRPKAKWETLSCAKVPYKSGYYEVKEVENTNATEEVKIISISQWITGDDGKSAIKTKDGTEIPKKTISLSGDHKVVREIANNLLSLVE